MRRLNSAFPQQTEVSTSTPGGGEEPAPRDETWVRVGVSGLWPRAGRLVGAAFVGKTELSTRSRGTSGASERGETLSHQQQKASRCPVSIGS